MAPVPGYREEIFAELLRRGHQVHLLEGCSKPKRYQVSPKQRLLRSLVYDIKLLFLAPELEKIETRFYSPLVQDLDNDYDYVFDFGGHAQENCLKILRKKLAARFVLYLWDDADNIPNNHGRFKYFDDIFSFNPQDCKTFGFQFRPSFYLPQFTYQGEDKNIDIFYKGSLRERKRSLLIEHIIHIANKQKHEISLYTSKGYLPNFFKVPNKEFFDKYCNNKYFNASQISSKSKHSKALLDISFRDQKGLSPRIFEAIAANSKIITTNRNIINYDIYNNNVCIIGENGENSEYIPHFITTDYRPYSENTLRKYSLTGFIDDVFQEPKTT